MTDDIDAVPVATRCDVAPWMLFHPTAVAKPHGSRVRSSWRSGRSARPPGGVSQFLWCFWYIYIYIYCISNMCKYYIKIFIYIIIYIHSYILSHEFWWPRWWNCSCCFPTALLYPNSSSKAKNHWKQKTHNPVFPSRESSGVCPKAILQLGRLQLSGQETFVLGCP